MDLIILILVCTLTYSFEAVFGLAGTILMLPILALFFDAKFLVIFSVFPSLITEASVLLFSPNTINYKILTKMFFFAALGAFLGFYIFQNINEEFFQKILGVVIIASGFYLMFLSQKIKINKHFSTLLDFISGFSHALFGISGPIFMTRLMSTFSNKTEIRNYALAFFTTINIMRLAWYIYSSQITNEMWNILLISAPFLIIAIYFANKLHFRINEAHFKKVVSYIIVFSGVLMFVK